jgi:hypothetical protein
MSKKIWNSTSEVGKKYPSENLMAVVSQREVVSVHPCCNLPYCIRKLAAVSKNRIYPGPAIIILCTMHVVNSFHWVMIYYLNRVKTALYPQINMYWLPPNLRAQIEALTDNDENAAFNWSLQVRITIILLYCGRCQALHSTSNCWSEWTYSPCYVKINNYGAEVNLQDSHGTATES